MVTVAVLVPGWLSPPSTLLSLDARLQAEGIQTLQVICPWWDPRNSLGDLAAHLTQQISVALTPQWRDLTSGGLHLVGHSLGGVVALLCAKQIRVHSVSALAAPLRGNRLAAVLGVGAIRQLRDQDHELLAARGAAHAPVLVVASHQDRVVSAQSALSGPPGCHTLDGRYGSHLGVLSHPEVQAAVLAHLRAAGPDPGRDRPR